jgi:heptosyltransferase-1
MLIVRLSSLGDVIQTLPVATAIRRSFPEAKIGWAIDSELVSAIAGHRDVDYIHACPRTHWRKAASDPWNWPAVGRDLKGFGCEIQAVGYDLAIDAQGLMVSALLPFMARISRRVGFAHRRELSHLFYTEKYVSKQQYFDSDIPHTEHMLTLARAIGCEVLERIPTLPESSPHLHRTVAAWLAFADGAPLIALAPDTQWASKRWPAQYWLELLDMILTNTVASVVLIGSGSEDAIGAELSRAQNADESARILNLVGKTTLPELFVLLGRAPIVIAPDTAPLHAAGAARCAHLIGIYGPTPPGRTGPSGSPDIRLLCAEPPLPCQPCRQSVCRYGTNQCMREVAPADIFAVLSRVMDLQAALQLTSRIPSATPRADAHSGPSRSDN